MEEAFEGLLSHDFDLIISEEYLGLPGSPREGVERLELLRDPLHLALPLEGPWSARPRCLSELAEAPWALDPVDTPFGAWGRAVCRQAGSEPRVRVDALNPLLQVDFVQSGHAMAFVPALLGLRHLSGVRSVGLVGAPYRLLSIQVRSGRTRHPAVVACRAAFVEAVAHMSVDQPERTLG